MVNSQTIRDEGLRRVMQIGLGLHRVKDRGFWTYGEWGVGVQFVAFSKCGSFAYMFIYSENRSGGFKSNDPGQRDALPCQERKGLGLGSKADDSDQTARAMPASSKQLDSPYQVIPSPKIKTPPPPHPS